MRYLLVVMVVALGVAGCATPYRGNVTDAPDTSHTNSGSVYFGKDGRMHTRPAYVVDNETPEQHKAAKAAADAYFRQKNEQYKKRLAAMTPAQRHEFICQRIAEDIQFHASSPWLSGDDPVFTYSLPMYRKEHCN